MNLNINPKRKLNIENGFSVIELLVSVSILAILVLGTASMLVDMKKSEEALSAKIDVQIEQQVLARQHSDPVYLRGQISGAMMNCLSGRGAGCTSGGQ